jgi:hypothetical protein
MCSVKTTIPLGSFVDWTSSRNPSTTGTEAVASGGWHPDSVKNVAKRPDLAHLLLDSPSIVNDNISPVVLPVRFPGTLVVAEVLNS